MTDVRILHEGGVGEHKAGEVVKDAYEGLVHIAENGIRNAADGKLVAEIVKAVEEVDEELQALRERAAELGVKGNISALKKETIQNKVAEAEESAKANA